jgi:hypothetical protein
MNKNLFIFPSLFLIVQPVFEFYDAVENEKVRNDFGPEARSAAASSRYVFFFYRELHGFSRVNSVIVCVYSRFINCH